MKNIILFIALIGLSSISNAQSSASQSSNTSIQLILKNSPEQVLRLRSLNTNMKYDIIDSVIIGNKLRADTLYYDLYVDPLDEKQIQLGFSKQKLNFVPLLQAGDHLKIEADFNNVGYIVYKGSTRTHEYREFLNEKSRIAGDSLLSYRMARKAGRADSLELKHKIDSIERLVGAYVRKSIFNTKSPCLVIWALMSAQNGVANFTKAEYALMRTRFKNYKYALMQIDINERVQEHPPGRKPKPANNTYLANFTLPDIDGKQLNLEQFRGKFILVDFWASWCGPCRKESPYLKQALQKFGRENFVILSVSIDERPEAWKTAIVVDGTNQFIHLIDTRGWKSDILKQYNIESIPCNFLVDPTGKIIDKDLRGSTIITRLGKAISAL